MNRSSQAPVIPGGTLEHSLEELVSRKTIRVPPYPATALLLSQVLAREDYATADLVEAMRADPVFAANLLRLANSPFYRRGAEVTSLGVAVQRLGGRELTRLAMASAVSKLSTSEGPLHGLRRRVWREALSSALVCEALCAFEGADTGEGFVAALLHDAGRLLVLSAIEDLWPQGSPLAERDEAGWATILTRFHVSFGEQLAQRWGLPGVLGAVITTHHDDASTHGPLTKRVVFADRVVALLESQPEVTSADLERLGLAPAHAQSLAVVLHGIPATLRAFDPTAPSRVRPETKQPVGGGLWAQVDGEPAWAVTAFEERGLTVRAPRLLAPHLLLEVTVLPAELQFWAIVDSCDSVGGGFTARLLPFALPPEAARQWQSLGQGQAA